jgi:hypothetical protein
MQGATQVCAGSKQIYSVINDPDALSYSWVIPSGVQILSGQGTNQIQVAFAQNYPTSNLCVYATNGCGTAAPYCMTLVRKHGRYCAIRVPTSWEQRENQGPGSGESDEVMLTIQPNPANEKTEVVIEGTEEGTYRLEVMNSLGEQIYLQEVTINAGEKVITLDLSTYAKGIYMVVISNGTSTGKSKFVVE